MEWLVLIAWLVAGLVHVADADAAEFDRTAISYQYGDGYATGDASRHTLTVDSMHKRAGYMVYVSFDAQSFTEPSSYTVSRVIGHAGDGLHLAGQMINQRGQSSTGIGIGFSHYHRSGFFGADLYHRSDNLIGTGMHGFVYWHQALRAGFYAAGFAEWTDTDRLRAPMLLAQPELMYRVTRNLSAGVEWQVYINKAGTGRDESVPQAKIKWVF